MPKGSLLRIGRANKLDFELLKQGLEVNNVLN